MRTYEVQPGDSPAKIASRDDMAGCPKCAIDLILANTHKPTVVHSNGYVTFRDLTVGEKLNVPEKWSSKEFDDRPRAYFAALPYADGVTRSTLGDRAAGVLGDYATYDTALAKLAQLTPMDNQTFSASVDDAIVPLDQSVKEADGSSNPAIAAYAQATHMSTNFAHQQNQNLIAALSASDQVAATAARLATQTALTTALSSAQLALQAVYGGAQPVPQVPVPPPASTFPATIIAAAQAAVSAISADSNYCSSVAQPGSPANSAVHLFKTAWNASNPTNPVPINTGTYDQATADVLTRVIGSAPPACPARLSPPLSPPPFLSPSQPPQQPQGLSTGSILGIGLLGVAAAGAAIYFASLPPKKTRSAPRVRRIRPAIRRDYDDTIVMKKDYEP